MAINPPSDIVLDVAKAVDPLQYRAAVDKLSRVAGDGAGFEQAFDLVASSADTSSAMAGPAKTGEKTVVEAANDVLDRFRVNLRDRLASDGTADAKEPYRQFEAFVLQTFVQSILPKDAEHVFGKGIAGSYWSSMLAEQIADQLSKAGGIGIAEALSPVQSAKAASAAAAFTALPGYVSSLELDFADAVRPSSDDETDSATGLV